MRRRVVPMLALATASIALAGGFIAHRVFDRPGESAYRLIPISATGVISLDFVPGTDQVAAFKAIDDAIKASTDMSPSNIGMEMSKSIEDADFKALAQQFDRSACVAYFGTNKDTLDGHALVYLPLKDQAAFESYLKAHGKPTVVNGTAMYKIARKEMEKSGGVYLIMIDGYGVGSDDPALVAAAQAVAKGQGQSILDNPDFMTVRDKAPRSANLFFAAAPILTTGKSWSYASMTVREHGFEIASEGDMDQKEVVEAGKLATISPDLMRRLPRGAYGFLAASQIGPAIGLAGKELDEPAKEMKDSMEMDLRTDVLPNLAGNMAVGLYPSYNGEAGLDLLISIDDAHGADPSLLARKLERFLAQMQEEEGDATEIMTTRTTPDAEIREISPELAEPIQDGIKSLEKTMLRPGTVSRGKTVTYATVGKTVILATSNSLLNQAILTQKNPGASLSLAGDRLMGANAPQLAQGQFTFAMSMQRLVEGIRNTVDPSKFTVEQAKAYRKTLALYDNTPEPMLIKAQVSPAGKMSASFFIPMNWASLAAFAKK